MLFMCEWWVGDVERLPHIDLKFLWPSQHFLILLGSSTGVLRTQVLCLELVLTPASYPQLRLKLNCNSNSNCNCNLNSASNSNWLKPSVAPGYIIVWHTPTSYGRTNLHRIQPSPQVKVIFRHPRPNAPASCYTGASLNWRLGWGSICYIMTAYVILY